jgi:predicted ATPase/class 3 adenylate cyclase
MSKLPSGTVTLLFTDIEGSTRLLQQLGDGYRLALAEHRRLLRAAFAEHGGQEVSAEGDAFFVAFARAGDAVAAAVNGQRALVAHPRAEGVGLRVRMGVHSGEPAVVAGDYVGLDVHRAARICSAGHGGQVLISRASCELVARGLSSGTGLRDLGMHRLKDLAQPEQLYQLVMSGLPADFPPLRTVGRRRTNLPAPVTAFVGRSRELGEIATLLGRKGLRLLTLTGPGGSGKTRLALRVAADLLEEFPDGVALVELAPVDDPALVVPAVAQALGVREVVGQPLFDAIIDRVGDQRLLLLLDNFEQVLSAAPVVKRLLVACPQLKVMVTSRAALHVSGGHEYPVPPLALPDPELRLSPAGLVESEAVALFADRARAVKPDFAVTAANAPTLAEICRRLDGLPLAIELAAVRMKLLPPEAILSRLRQRLPLLTGGARDLPARQQTLQATIDWSYRLLAPREQRLFARLAVFAGGCTLEAAEAVCDLEGDADVLSGLDSLLDNSLVRRSDGDQGEPRVGMLETIREYALALLEARDEAAVLARRHAGYFLALVERAELLLSGPQQVMWFQRFDADLDNFRAALAWSVAQQQPELTAKLAAGLRLFWEHRGAISEELGWLDAALEHRGSLSPPTLAKVVSAKAALLLVVRGDLEQAKPLLEESLQLSQDSGDPKRVVRILSYLGIAAMLEDDHHRSTALHHKAVALARQLNDRQVLAVALVNQSGLYMVHGDHVQAKAALNESLSYARELGDRRGVAVILGYLAVLALSEEDHEDAVPMMEESLAVGHELGNPALVASPLCGLGLAALYQGDDDRAAALFEESLTLARSAEDVYIIRDCLWGLAGVAGAKGQPSRAVRLCGAAATLDETLGFAAPDVRPLRERLEATVRERLKADAFETEFTQGRATSMDQAIAYALERIDGSEQPADR